MKHIYDMEINPETTQIVLLNKIILAYNLLRDSEEEHNAFNKENLQDVGKFFGGIFDGSTDKFIEQHLIFDTKEEAYRMLIVNYLTAITGSGRFDKNSLINNIIEPKRDKIEKFYSKHKKTLEYLKDVRDKLYAHFDNDYLEKAHDKPSIDYDVIKSLIEDLKDIIDYDGNVVLK